MRNEDIFLNSLLCFVVGYLAIYTTMICGDVQQVSMYFVATYLWITLLGLMMNVTKAWSKKDE